MIDPDTAMQIINSSFDIKCPTGLATGNYRVAIVGPEKRGRLTAPQEATVRRLEELCGILFRDPEDGINMPTEMVRWEHMRPCTTPVLPLKNASTAPPSSPSAPASLAAWQS